MTIPGIELWKGPSMIGDRKPIVYIALMFSENTKTDNMIQTYIIPQRKSALAHYRAHGHISTVCGSCPLQGYFSRKLAKFVDRSCYVNLGHGPRNVWNAWKRGNYPVYHWREHDHLFIGRRVRHGAFGDPLAGPISITRRIDRLCAGRSGYSHSILDVRPDRAKAIGEFCMASAHSAKLADEFYARGMRFYQTILPGEEPHPSAIQCPNATHGTKCLDCRLCDPQTKAKSIWNYAHGVGASNLERARL